LVIITFIFVWGFQVIGSPQRNQENLESEAIKSLKNRLRVSNFKNIDL